MKRFLLCMILATSAQCLCFGQSSPQVNIPDFDDKYCNYIRKLESGETDIDYLDFRYSFIESEQFKVANSMSTIFDSLKSAMYSQMSKSSYDEIISTTKQMLSIDYTSMLAHKILRQTYKILGDTVNAAKYKTIQFGLMNSISKNGDGSSCETGWPVIQISEEYFFLYILEAELLQQSLISEDGLCDKMDVKVDGKKKTYYFEVSKIFEGYKKLGM